MGVVSSEISENFRKKIFGNLLQSLLEGEQELKSDNRGSTSTRGGIGERSVYAGKS